MPTTVLVPPCHASRYSLNVVSRLHEAASCVAKMSSRPLRVSILIKIDTGSEGILLHLLGG